MSKTTIMWILVAAMTSLIVGCDKRQPTSESTPDATGTSTATPSAVPASISVTDQWMGKWIGPEGTFLLLSKKGDRYIVEVHSLDGSQTYEGSAAGNRIDFVRNGKSESIHEGNGVDTGMKWLLEKKNCLIIKTGEGFCRD